MSPSAGVTFQAAKVTKAVVRDDKVLAGVIASSTGHLKIMDKNANFSHLMQPLRIPHPGGVLELRNRVLVSAHVPGFAENNQPGDQYIAYHKRYAAEGVGLQITGGTPVHESGLLSLRSDALWNLDDGVIPGYKKLAGAIHREGGRILAQLAHSGGTVQIDKPGVTSWSASAVRSAITGHVSHAMTQAEIDEVIQAFADGARRVKEGEMDGVEVLAAFGFLPQAFLSPLTNFRDDQYGGSLSNRLRFLIELLIAVRAQLAPNQILGVRLPGDEFEPGGLQLEDMKRVCKELSEKGLVDYINIIAHTNFTPTGRARHWAPTPTAHGIFVDLAAAIKAEVTVPVFAVGRIVDPAHADRIIARGQADMVGMTRAHICDPTIVRKIMNSQSAQIRPCVGANTCIANRYTGKPIRCMHNPELKTPGKVLQPALRMKQVVVIGAGPAGLEAARLCAERGHQVTVYEQAATTGGQLAYWTRAKSMTELHRIIDWRMAELERLDVTIKLNKKIKHHNLAKLQCDQLIIATGATDITRGFASVPGTQVVTPMQLLDSDSLEVNRAIVISDGRGQAGLVCAEWLCERNAQVEIISEDIAVANDLDPTNRNAWYERLGQRGVVFTAQTKIESIESGVVQLRDLYSQQASLRQQIDLVVDWNGCRSQDDLVYCSKTHQLLISVSSIGDCVAPRNVETAMAEALLIAEEV